MLTEKIGIGEIRYEIRIGVRLIVRKKGVRYIMSPGIVCVNQRVNFTGNLSCFGVNTLNAKNTKAFILNF